MNAPTPPVVAAKARATAARARLSGTIGALRHRISPQVLAQDAAETIKDKSVALVHSAVDTAQARPRAFAAVASGIGLLLLRRPLIALFRRATRSND